MRRFFILVMCLSTACIHAKEATFSLDRLKEFYETFFCEEKEVLSSLNLTDACSTSFWVSPNGNDSNPGTEEAPFLTLQRARDAVRALPADSRNADVFVYIEDGTYRLQEPLALESIDSGKRGHDVIWKAAPGAHPVISGALQVSNWTLHDAMLGIYSAPVGSNFSRQLYVNGARAQRAQTTAFPPAFLVSWLSGGIEFVPDSTLNPYPWFDPGTWTNPSDIEAIMVSQWKMIRVPLSSITPYSFPTPGLITLQQPAWDNANVYRDINTNLPNEWSFFETTRFENAYEFLLNPGQWYLDRTAMTLYYIPLPGEDILTADVELPILETLVVGQGTPENSIHNIRFEGLTFSYATWLLPSTPDGYVSDQSAQILVGSGHPINYIGHDQFVIPTPGNVAFSYADSITFYGNIFEHLGAVGLQFGFGSRNNTIDSNLFTDISSSAIELGAATANDSHPSSSSFLIQNNLITNNLIRSVARDYQDAAGIYVGFTQYTILSHNTIVDVPWSGIALGWGWGLLDPGSFPGLPNAVSGQWGIIDTLTPNLGCQVLNNKFTNYLNILWDAGAVYTTGRQGPTQESGLLIKGNVAYGKRVLGGSNTIYTDGGSRCIRVESNASYDNPVGVTDYGPPPNPMDPFFLFYPPYWLLGGQPYGSDSGGCRTYGDIRYTGNYWLETPIPANEAAYNAFYQMLLGFAPYTSEGFFAICPITISGVSYPTQLTYKNNHQISSQADIPTSLLLNAGVQSRPSTIPQDQWVLP